MDDQRIMTEKITLLNFLIERQKVKCQLFQRHRDESTENWQRAESITKLQAAQGEQAYLEGLKNEIINGRENLNNNQ